MADACCSCEGIKTIVKDIVKEIFDERIEELKKTIGARKERKLSKWQGFLKECIPKKADLPFKERVKACSIDYKKAK